MHLYIYAHTYTCICIHTYIYMTHTYKYIWGIVCACICVCLCVYMCVCTHIHKHMCIHTYIWHIVYTYIWWMCVCMYICVYTCIYAYICIYTLIKYAKDINHTIQTQGFEELNWNWDTNLVIEDTETHYSQNIETNEGSVSNPNWYIDRVLLCLSLREHSDWNDYKVQRTRTFAMKLHLLYMIGKLQQWISTILLLKQHQNNEHANWHVNMDG